MKRRLYILIFLSAVMMTAAAFAARIGDPLDYDLTWHTIDGGGGTSTGGDPGSEYTLTGTIGQPDAGLMTGGDPGDQLEITGGFWAGAGRIPAPLCPPDIAPSGGDGNVDVHDLLAVISDWGICTAPCPPSCDADINGDCTVDVNDLLAVINGWGPCP